MKWFPLCNFTHYSLCKGFSKPDELAEKCAKEGYRACGIADYKSISGAIAFVKACEKAKIKPIIGCSFDDFTLFAKNEKGWLDLIELVSSFDKEMNLDTQTLSSICSRGNLICLADNEAQSPVSGPDFYSNRFLFPESYYAKQSDAVLHRVLICVGMKTTLPKINQKLHAREDFPNRKFFESDSYYLADATTALEIELNEDLSIFNEIFDKCESYKITHPPRPPKFPVPEGFANEEEYLKQLCRDGWAKNVSPLLHGRDDPKRQIYLDRFLHEFEVFKTAKLFGYFLIVDDIINFVDSNGWLSGPGRGSAAGSLISFLLDIIKVDPIEYDLLFERFYNAGRNTAEHVSYPDIDMDLPVNKRAEILAYIRSKYGEENVCQMITYGRLQGRSAIKEVLRVNEACGFAEMNEITKHIPDEARIADQLEEMDEDERSIIMWALQNREKELYEFCFINSDGELDGTYAQYFKQAIAMEGTFKSQGKHASGVVISTEPMYKICPMVNQKNADEKLAGFELEDLEAAGHLKLDLLGLSLLDKLMYIRELTEKS